MHNRKWEEEKEEEKRLMGKQLENTTTTKTNALEGSWEGATCQLIVSNWVMTVWSSRSQTVCKKSLLFKLIPWDSHCLQLSSALGNLATEADVLGLCITQPIPAINPADHESSVGPRHVAWEAKQQLGNFQNRNDDNLVCSGFFFFRFESVWRWCPGSDGVSCSRILFHMKCQARG